MPPIRAFGVSEMGSLGGHYLEVGGGFPFIRHHLPCGLIITPPPLARKTYIVREAGIR